MVLSKTEKFLLRWEREKARGLLSYILRWGLLYYGGLYFLIWVFLVPFINNMYTFDFIYRDTFITKCILFGITSFPIGAVFGLASWKGNEKKYNNLK